MGQRTLSEDLRKIQRTATCGDAAHSNDDILLVYPNGSVYLCLDFISLDTLDGPGHGRISCWVWVYFPLQLLQ